jgi:twitching motility protein PilT
MQSGKKFGMQTLNDALYQLYMAREVARDDCLRVSSDPNEFLRMIGEPPLADDAAELMKMNGREGKVASASGKR